MLGTPALHDSTATAQLATRLRWLVVLRLVFLTILLGLTVALYWRGGFGWLSFSLRVLIDTLAGGYLLAALYTVVLRRGRRLVELAYAQLVLDQATWTALIYLTGGVTSGATALYGLTCLVGAILMGPAGSGVAALTGGGFYLLLCTGFVTGLLRPPPDQLHAYVTTPAEVVIPFLINLLVLFVVTLLANFLADLLERERNRLREATVRAEQAERLAALGKLAAGLAHEIRNPLGSIVGSIQLLGASAGLDSEARQLFGIVERETARLNELVEDMLHLARPRRPESTPVDVARTVREVVALASHTGRGGDVVVRYEGPEPNEPLVCRADAGQLRQVVWNLLRNAIQASAAGAAVSVRVISAGSGGATITVHDDGPGIGPEARARLFDAFFTSRSSGVGIGLAVVKRIVDDHGWSIDVESREGRGATFSVQIPSAAKLEPAGLLATGERG